MSEPVYFFGLLILTIAAVFYMFQLESYKDLEKKEDDKKDCDSCDEYNINKSAQYKQYPSLPNPSDSCKKTICERDNSIYNGYLVNPSTNVFTVNKNNVDEVSPYSQILKDVAQKEFPQYEDCNDFKRCRVNGVAIGKQGVIP